MAIELTANTQNTSKCVGANQKQDFAHDDLGQDT
jgi:hypothetical protein